VAAASAAGVVGEKAVAHSYIHLLNGIACLRLCNVIVSVAGVTDIGMRIHPRIILLGATGTGETQTVRFQVTGCG
jgi:hypothetical protein